jgi:Methylamine utilisation protein MauE.
VLKCKVSMNQPAGTYRKVNWFSEFIHKRRNIIIEFTCALFILLFLYTGTAKFLDFKGFIGDMNNQPFPNWMTPYIVWSIPTIEILISLALMFEKTKRVALYSSLVLMSMFTIYTGAVLFRFFDRVPCSCGGVIKQLTWQQHLVFNLFFVVLAIIGLVMQKGKRDGEVA